MNKTTNRIAKALGVSALVASLLFGSISCKDSKKTLDEKVSQASITQIVQQENPVIQDIKTSQESYIQTEPQTEKYTREIESIQESPISENQKEESEMINFYEKLKNNNIALEMNEDGIKVAPKGTRIGYDIISDKEKDFLIYYDVSNFKEIDKTGKVISESFMPIISFNAEITEHIIVGDTHYFNLNYSDNIPIEDSYVAITYKNNNIIVYNKGINSGDFFSLIENSPVNKKFTKEAPTYNLETNTILDIKNKKEYEYPYILLKSSGISEENYPKELLYKIDN